MYFSILVQHMILPSPPDRALMAFSVADLSILAISVLPNSSTQFPIALT